MYACIQKYVIYGVAGLMTLMIQIFPDQVHISENVMLICSILFHSKTFFFKWILIAEYLLFVFIEYVKLKKKKN